MLLGQAPRADGVFEHAFTAPGVYDYFCRPHELAGMAGRIVVGDPGDGPGTKPFGYDPAKSWKPVPAAVRTVLPAPGEIVRKGAVRAP